MNSEHLEHCRVKWRKKYALFSGTYVLLKRNKSVRLSHKIAIIWLDKCVHPYTSTLPILIEF